MSVIEKANFLAHLDFIFCRAWADRTWNGNFLYKVGAATAKTQSPLLLHLDLETKSNVNWLDDLVTLI